jgi:hypothetical protein
MCKMCSTAVDCNCGVPKGKKRVQRFVEQRARFCPRWLFRVVGRKQRGRESGFCEAGRASGPVMYATHTATRSRRRLENPIAPCELPWSNARQAVRCTRPCFPSVLFAFAFQNISSCNFSARLVRVTTSRVDLCKQALSTTEASETATLVACLL